MSKNKWRALRPEIILRPAARVATRSNVQEKQRPGPPRLRKRYVAALPVKYYPKCYESGARSGLSSRNGPRGDHYYYGDRVAALPEYGAEPPPGQASTDFIYIIMLVLGADDPTQVSRDPCKSFAARYNGDSYELLDSVSMFC